ncbi:MAG: hypothetical protein OYH77_02680 [Pseudomonadota bacterium]|nr:hypothetical protein [Pseudomonadota bacterium]
MSLSIGCLLSSLALAVDTTGATDTYHKIVSADIRSVQAGVVTIPAAFNNGESTTIYDAQVRGTLVLTVNEVLAVTVPTAQDRKQYATQYAKDNYCADTANLTGTLTFNAGKHISIDLGTGSLSGKAATTVELVVETLPKTNYGTTKVRVSCR